jgi:hypothetical protein
MIKIISKIFLNNKLHNKIKVNITPLGRWNIENNIKKIDIKIDLSNEDHCGPCGQYILDKRNNIIDKNINIDKILDNNFNKNIDKNINKNIDKNINKNIDKYNIFPNKQFITLFRI